MLHAYSPHAKQCVVVFYPEDNCHQFVPSQHAGRADYVVLTDARVHRSHDYFRSGGA